MAIDGKLITKFESFKNNFIWRKWQYNKPEGYEGEKQRPEINYI